MVYEMKLISSGCTNLEQHKMLKNTKSSEKINESFLINNVGKTVELIGVFGRIEEGTIYYSVDWCSKLKYVFIVNCSTFECVMKGKFKRPTYIIPVVNPEDVNIDSILYKKVKIKAIVTEFKDTCYDCYVQRYYPFKQKCTAYNMSDIGLEIIKVTKI